MPVFKFGSPQVVFRKKNGKEFTKTFHSRTSAAKAVKAWRKRGGTVVRTQSYDPHGLTNSYRMRKVRGSNVEVFRSSRWA